MQPRALGNRVSDEFTVPVCRIHHRELHRHGDEAAWWGKVHIAPVPFAHRLWQHTRLNSELAPTIAGITPSQAAKSHHTSVPAPADTNNDTHHEFELTLS